VQHINEHATIELLFAGGPDVEPRPTIIFPHLPGSGAAGVAHALVSTVGDGRRQLVPAPPVDVGQEEHRAWHRDLWYAMSAVQREKLTLATGPTALFLAPTMAEEGRAIVLVREPLAAAHAIGKALPKPRLVSGLASTPLAEAPSRLRRFANPQSRALMAPWHDTAQLAVSDGPPDDADHWREALFEEVLPRVQVVPSERAASVTDDLIDLVGARRKPVMHAVRAIATVHEPDDEAAKREALRRLSWLDAELHAHILSAPTLAS
jgi:hypothetical protein